MTSDGITPTKSEKVFVRLLRLLRPFWGWIGFSGLLVILAAPCELFPAVVWKYVTDVIVLKKHESDWMTRWFSFNGHLTGRVHLLISSVAWLLVVYVLGETMEAVEGWILNRVAEKFILDFRNTVYTKLQGQSLGYLQRQRTGDLMSRVMGDVEQIQQFIVSSIDVIFSEGLLWLMTVAFVIYLDWRVATVSLAPLVVVYFLLRVFNRKIKPIYAAARDRLGDVGNRLQENLSGVVVIKIFNREKAEADRFRDSTTRYYKQQIKAITARSIFFPFTHVVGFFSNVFMIGLGGYYMIYGSFTPGDLVAFRSYWWRLFGPIQTLARLNDMIQRANAAGKRVFDVLDAPDELADAGETVILDRVVGRITLENVSFSYRTESVEKPVLRGINLDIQAGQTLAICGPSGSGKSTLLNLILRFYDPVAGRVLLDGVDLKTLATENFRRGFALVQQETFLFNDTLLDNIRYGQSDATMEQVIAAATAANAHEFISQMPDGYDTKVGERGIRLSGGQKQRISIARAFLANPAVLLLDEPTSSVEPESEAAIVAALSRLMKHRTTIVTSHRPSLIESADVVAVVEDGRVTAVGTPAELAKAGGWYERFTGLDRQPIGS